MQTKGGAPVLPGRAREEGGAAPPFRPTRRPMPAEPAAALPPRSAPRSEHAARCECSVSETPRAAADRGAAALHKTPPALCAVRAKKRAALKEMLRPVSPHRTRHLRHFSGQRKVSVLMRTTWGGPGSASAGWCFPGLNQKTSKAGRRTDPFRSSGRPLKAEKAAALPPRSAHRSEHAAQCECSVSETPRAAADGDVATPRKTSHPRAARRKCRTQTKNLPRAGKSTPRNVPRGTFRRPAILQKQCSTWNILSKIRSAPPRNSHYI